MSQHLWFAFTDQLSGQTFYVPYEAVASVTLTPLSTAEDDSTITLYDGTTISVPGSPSSIFGSMAAQFAADGESFVSATYPPPST